MDVAMITVERAAAEREYKSYRDAIKTGHDAAYLHDLKVAYGHLRRGHPVIDVWQAFADSGVDDNGDPKIAIARADWPEVVFSKLSERELRFQGIFSHKDRWPHTSWRSQKLTDISEDDVTIPNGTLTFKTRSPNGGFFRPRIRTKTPIIPARFVPPHGLGNYHILWEVEKWDIVTPPRDPLLLKRVSPNVFVILAAWELTDLERAIIRGRIA